MLHERLQGGDPPLVRPLHGEGGEPPPVALDLSPGGKLKTKLPQPRPPIVSEFEQYLSGLKTGPVGVTPVNITIAVRILSQYLNFLVQNFPNNCSESARCRTWPNEEVLRLLFQTPLEPLGAFLQLAREACGSETASRLNDVLVEHFYPWAVEHGYTTFDARYFRYELCGERPECELTIAWSCHVANERKQAQPDHYARVYQRWWEIEKHVSGLFEYVWSLVLAKTSQSPSAQGVLPSWSNMLQVELNQSLTDSLAAYIEIVASAKGERDDAMRVFGNHFIPWLATQNIRASLPNRFLSCLPPQVPSIELWRLWCAHAESLVACQTHPLHPTIARRNFIDPVAQYLSHIWETCSFASPHEVSMMENPSREEMLSTRILAQAGPSVLEFLDSIKDSTWILAQWRSCLLNTFYPYLVESGLIQPTDLRMGFRAFGRVQPNQILDQWSDFLYSGLSDVGSEAYRQAWTHASKQRDIVLEFFEFIGDHLDAHLASKAETLVSVFRDRTKDLLDEFLKELRESRNDETFHLLRRILEWRFLPWAREQGFTDFDARREAVLRGDEIPPLGIFQGWRGSLEGAAETLPLPTPELKKRAVRVVRKYLSWLWRGHCKRCPESSLLEDANGLIAAGSILTDLVVQSPLLNLKAYFHSIADPTVRRFAYRAICKGFYAHLYGLGLCKVDVAQWSCDLLDIVPQSSLVSQFLSQGGLGEEKDRALRRLVTWVWNELMIDCRPKGSNALIANADGVNALDKAISSLTNVRVDRFLAFCAREGGPRLHGLAMAAVVKKFLPWVSQSHKGRFSLERFRFCVWPSAPHLIEYRFFCDSLYDPSLCNKDGAPRIGTLTERRRQVARFIESVWSSLGITTSLEKAKDREALRNAIFGKLPTPHIRKFVASIEDPTERGRARATLYSVFYPFAYSSGYSSFNPEIYAAITGINGGKVTGLESSLLHSWGDECYCRWLSSGNLDEEKTRFLVFRLMIEQALVHVQGMASDGLGVDAALLRHREQIAQELQRKQGARRYRVSTATLSHILSEHLLPWLDAVSRQPPISSAIEPPASSDGPEQDSVTPVIGGESSSGECAPTPPQPIHEVASEELKSASLPIIFRATNPDLPIRPAVVDKCCDDAVTLLVQSGCCRLGVIRQVLLRHCSLEGSSILHPREEETRLDVPAEAWDKILTYIFRARGSTLRRVWDELGREAPLFLNSERGSFLPPRNNRPRSLSSATPDADVAALYEDALDNVGTTLIKDARIPWGELRRLLVSQVQTFRKLIQLEDRVVAFTAEQWEVVEHYLRLREKYLGMRDGGSQEQGLLVFS